MLFGKPKIGYDGSPVRQEDICQFQISMQKVSLGHINKSWNYILGEFKGLKFTESSFFLQVPTEISFVTEFSYNIAMGCLTHDIIAPQDVGVFQFGEGLDLAI